MISNILYATGAASLIYSMFISDINAVHFTLIGYGNIILGLLKDIEDSLK